MPPNILASLTPQLITLDDIRSAADRIAGIVRRTPLLDVEVARQDPQRSPTAPLWLKCENLQPMGAFKLRGATNMLAQLTPAERAAGVITYSSGNHGLAVAVAARRLGVRAVVTVPEAIPQVKVDGIRRAGADVIYAGTTVIDRRKRAEQEVAERGLTMVPPFDHAWIIAGQGTVGLEIVEQLPDVRTVYVPLGGGGLASGVASAVKLSGASARVIGVEPAGAPKVSTSLAAGHPVTLARTDSIADGLLSLRPGDLTFAHLQRYLDGVVTVEEDAIAAAVRWLFAEARLVVEPSGAVSVAAALAAGAEPGPVVAVISGGNVDPERYIQCLRPISSEPYP
jgi:threonine dehydratase